MRSFIARPEAVLFTLSQTENRNVGRISDDKVEFLVTLDQKVRTADFDLTV